MKKDNILSEEYKERVTRAVENGTFFKDSIQWYQFEYLRPCVDRNLMIFFSIIGVFCSYLLYQMITESFPLIKKVPVIIREHDTSKLKPFIKRLKPTDKEIRLTADEATIKYLLSLYVRDRESFDYRDSNVKDVNTKFNKIKNNSTYLEYRNFQSQMSRSNPSSPINFFGQNIYRAIEIESFKFIKEGSSGIVGKILQDMNNIIPTKAEVKFKSRVLTESKVGKVDEKESRFLVKIEFDFSGLDRNKKSGSLNIKVKKYELFEIK